MDTPLIVIVVLAFLVGLIVGRLLAVWMVRLTRDEAPADERAWSWRGGRGLLVEAGTGLLFAAFVFATLGLNCQDVPEVRPSDFWRYGRVVSHLVLISLLIVATGTDFRTYTISDAITLPGILAAVVVAAVSGDVQLVPLWVDWNQEHPLFGPYIPLWISEHPHWHGLAWSMAGLLAGGGTTWLVRAVSSWVLGREALGFGDVTLMALIGSFVGWQPVVFVFLLAPLCGLAVGLAIRLVSARTFVPYGPYLCLAAVVVLFSWRWLWRFEMEWTAATTLSVRGLFGDWPSLAILGGVALTALVGLLALLRLYRAIPVKRRG